MIRRFAAATLIVTSCGGTGVPPTRPAPPAPPARPERPAVDELRVIGDTKIGETLLARFATGPSLVVDGNEEPVVAWMELFNLSPRMRIARRVGADWRLIDQRNGCAAPALAIAESGTLVATRVCPVGTDDGVFVARYVDNAWQEINGPEQDGAVGIGPHDQVYGVVGIDSVGTISIVIAGGVEGLRLLQHRGREWEPLPAIGGMSVDAHHPALAVAPRGVLTLAWSEAKNSRASTEVYGAQFDGSWRRFGGGDGVVSRHPPIQATPRGDDGQVCFTMREGNFSSDSPSLASGPNGQIWLAWRGATVAGPRSLDSRCISTQIYVGTYADGVWRGPANAALDPGISSAVMTTRTPSIAFPFRGRPLLAWLDDDNRSVIHVRSGGAAQWSPVSEFSDISAAFGPVLAVHAPTVCMAWSFSAGIGIRCAR
jgi:hypothetical protein